MANMAMDKRSRLQNEPAWNALQTYYENNRSRLNMSEMFKCDYKRFEKYRLIIYLYNNNLIALGPNYKIVNNRTAPN